MRDSIDYNVGAGVPRGSDEENDGAESVGAASSLGTWGGPQEASNLATPLGRQTDAVCVVRSQLE